MVLVASLVGGVYLYQKLSAPVPNSITVTSADVNGTGLTGFKIELRVSGETVQTGYTPVTFANLNLGTQYQVIAYWYGNYYFRHFTNGELNRYLLVTLNSTKGQDYTTTKALFQYVPAQQAASLNVIAQFPNGTQIGTTFNTTTYIQHTPGMWFTIAVQGSSDPLSGSFTGGSLLPFVLFNHDSYTIQMADSYKNVHFSRWQDTGSSSSARTVTMNGNTTYVAVYVQT
jgi:hypothetical protein